jgi:hypothetical protein
MAVPSALRESLHDPVFWARYTFAHEDGPGADRLGDIKDLLDDDVDGDWDADDTSLDVEFDVGGGYRVLLTVDGQIDLARACGLPRSEGGLATRPG